MRKWIGALVLSALFFGANTMGTASATEVVVVRGDNAELVTVNRSGLTVLRGGGGMRATPPSEAKAALALRIAAGKTLWIVGDNGRAVAACFLTKGMYVGKRRIRCTDR